MMAIVTDQTACAKRAATSAGAPLLLAAAALMILGLGGCWRGGEPGGEPAQTDRPTVGFVTNCVDPFWVIAKKGAEDAAAKFGATVETRMPPDGIADQKRMVQELLARGVAGLAISPIDPTNQGELLAEIAASAKLITHDSDAPASPRLCYIGLDNYQAGRMAAALARQALPQGGRVMIFVGRIEQDNGRLRRQGFIDALLGRSQDRTRFDPPGVELRSDDGRYVVVDTRTDDNKHDRAKANAQDALARYGDLDAMIGLFAYNSPMCLEAIKAAGRVGRVKVIAFDEDDRTLEGIAAGEVVGTVVQNPYQYGYESVRILTALARGETDVIPANGLIDIAARTVNAANVAEFRAEKARLLAP